MVPIGVSSQREQGCSYRSKPSISDDFAFRGRSRARASKHITVCQQKELERCYEVITKPPTDFRKALARNQDLHLDTVSNWFRKRRAKERKKGHSFQNGNVSFNSLYI